MNKTKLTAHVAHETGLSKVDAGRAVDAVLAGITTHLANGGEVVLTGFGTFSVGKREARVGRNPSTGEEIDIPESRVAKFKAGSQLKSALN